MELGTKAETLDGLMGQLSEAKVLPLLYFTVSDYAQKRKDYWKIIWERWIRDGGSVIVRSSARNEDTREASQAGKFESVANIFTESDFYNAVEAVIASFDDDNPENQVLVQPMLQDVKLCGVAFTVEPNTNGNYYVINYDTTGSTSAITSGTGKNNKLLYAFKGKENKSEPKEIQRLYVALQELEVLFGQPNLDVEFAITNAGELYILQVRSLVLRERLINYDLQKAELKRIERRIQKEQRPKPFLCGEKTIYGVMPDWNPAEMIGIRPKPLALSLYKEIITDSVWAYQRHNYGYRNLRSFPLMIDFGGLPYIDIRVSFNSFIPARLDGRISEKLVNYYIQRLRKEPSKHDKVEFDIAFTCYTLDLPERIEILKEYGFVDSEISQILDALRRLTKEIINHETGLWRKDYAKIEILKKRYEEILSSDMEYIEKIYWLIEDCKRYGTLPFAGLARAAFIAVSLLRSLVTKEILTEEDYQCFMNDLDTVSSNMNHDYEVLTKMEFLEKYGHLRPGTYDINSKRYDEAAELYFDWDKQGGRIKKEKAVKKFSLTMEQLHKLSDALRQHGLGDNVLELLDFIKGVIEGREYGKFVFTRNLSKALQMIEKLGEQYGISREECAYIPIQSILELYTTTNDVGDALRTAVRIGEKNYHITKSITLPPLIVEPSDVWEFYYPDSEPNYITLSCIRGETVILENKGAEVELADKLLLIPSADPGYDWIFSHGIKGFITEYGGVNSHMAIRAGELGIPAVIGVGEKAFMQYRGAKMVEIDCLAKIIRILR
ncbi:MAG: PEP/pyruvate-binding domain-containing protein [Acetivibrio ethanolgignens]